MFFFIKNNINYSCIYIFLVIKLKRNDTIGGGLLVSKEKLFERIKRNPKNIDETKFRSLLKKYGFIIDSSRGKGGYVCYYHPDFPEIPIRTVNFTKPMRRHLVLKLIKDVEYIQHKEGK